ILDHSAASDIAPAIFTLRQMGITAASDVHLRETVLKAVDWEEEHADHEDNVEPPYEIDAETAGYPFTLRVPPDDPVLVEMVQALADGQPFGLWRMNSAD